MEHENDTEKNESGLDSSRLLYLIGYLYDETLMKKHLGFTSSYNFSGIGIEQKNNFLRRLTQEVHQNTKRDRNIDDFYSGIGNRPFSLLFHFLSNSILRFTDRIQRLFVPK